MSHFSIIFAAGSKGEFGYQNTLPWPHIKEITDHFDTITNNAVVIYGRKAFESFQCKPLKDRINIVISNTLKNTDGIIIVGSLDDALIESEKIIKQGKVYNCFVIGGKSIIEEARKKQWEYFYITTVKSNNITFNADIIMSICILIT